MYFYCDLHMFMIHRSLCLNKETITKLNIYVYVQLTLWHTNISGTIYRPNTGKHVLDITCAKMDGNSHSTTKPTV